MKSNTFLTFIFLIIIVLAVVFVVKPKFLSDYLQPENSQESIENSAEQANAPEEEGNNMDGSHESAESPDEQTSVIEGEGYYWDNSQKVIAVIDAKQSNDIPSDSEVINILEERGFTGCTVTYEYDLDGNYYEETEISDSSSEKHPMCLAYYMNDRGEMWTIHVINGKVLAYPSTFNLDSDLQAEIIVSETKEITSYDYETNKYIVTIPKDTAAIVMTVDRIDAETLEKLTVEEISNYEK